MISEKVSPQRILFMSATLVLWLAGSVFLCFDHIEQRRVFISLCIVAFILVLCVFLLAVYDREKEKDYYFGTDFGKIFLMSILAWAAAIGGSFLPGFFFPAGLLVFILAGVMESISAVALSVLICLLLHVTAAGPAGVFLAYAMVCVYAGLISDFMKKSDMKRRLPAALMLLPVLSLIPSIFYYDTYEEMGTVDMGLFLAGGAVTTLFAVVLYPLIYGWLRSEKRALYDSILDEEHPLLKEYKAYSPEEYKRALKTYLLSKLCAMEINADVNLAAAGGIYCRIGKIYGEPEAENALKAAYKYRFPRELMVLMGEYGAMHRKPSSVESAIVHIVDSLLQKIDSSQGDNVSEDSDWDKEMIIYRTLNDLSQTGVYDESGLTINQFLAIRKCLVREEKLI